MIAEDLCDWFRDGALVCPPLGNSDHNTIMLCPEKRLNSVEKTQSALVWDFRESHVSEFLRRLTETDFSSLGKEINVNVACDKFYEIVLWPLSAIP